MSAGSVVAGFVLTGVAVLGGAGSVVAQDYPVKPVRVLVGFAPGGGIDISARALTPGLSAKLGSR